MNNNEANMTMI